MYKEVHRFISLLVLTVLLGGCANQQPGESITQTRLLLDTYCTITVYGSVDSGLIDPGLLDEAFALIEEFEALFSITAEGSDVWRINHAEGEPVTVDPRTLEVIGTGLVFSELSDGMFDITVGRLSRLWDFGGSAANSPAVPSGVGLTEALQTVDFRQVVISADGGTVQLTDPDAWIDLGAIAKGYIGDKVAAFLTGRGVSSGLIDLGGDVVAIGSRQGESPWRIGIRDPFGGDDGTFGVGSGGTGGLLGAIEVSDASVISSGTYERRFEINGKNYHHILDPKTGMPVISDVVSATVVTGSALIGEGLSTIAVLIGSESAPFLFSGVPDFIGAVLVLENREILVLGDVKLVG